MNLKDLNGAEQLGIIMRKGDWDSRDIDQDRFIDLTKAKDKLHLLLGLKKILLDIDKAIKIVRETEEESEVVPNLMIGFGIDEIQAEYVAEIKLRHLNREYILKRLSDIDDLKASIEDMEDILNSKSRVKRIIVDELTKVSEKYGRDRKSEIIYDTDTEEEFVEEIPDYEANLFFTRDGYFKKITPLSLRMGGEQKLKEGDELVCAINSRNSAELLFFTDKCQVYKAKASDFEDTKASALGDFIPSKLEFEKDEKSIYMAVTSDYKGYMLFVFENGKVAKVTMSGYATKTNRKKLIKAYSDKSPIVSAMYIEEDTEVVLSSTAGRHLLVNTGAISPKAAKDTAGVNVMTLKKYHKLQSVRLYKEGEFVKPHRYRTKTLPAAGATLSADDTAEQLTLE